MFSTSFEFQAGQSIELFIGGVDSRHFGSMENKGQNENTCGMVLMHHSESEQCSLQLPIQDMRNQLQDGNETSHDNACNV